MSPAWSRLIDRWRAHVDRSTGHRPSSGQCGAALDRDTSRHWLRRHAVLDYLREWRAGRSVVFESGLVLLIYQVISLLRGRAAASTGWSRTGKVMRQQQLTALVLDYLVVGTDHSACGRWVRRRLRSKRQSRAVSAGLDAGTTRRRDRPGFGSDLAYRARNSRGSTHDFASNHEGA